MNRIPHTYNRDCAYVNVFPILAEGFDVVILKTYAKYVFMSFGRKNSGWMDMWGLNPQGPDSLSWKTFAIWEGGGSSSD
jgi:hypothetical protein